VYSARWIECSDKKKLEEFSNKAVENLALDGGGAFDLSGADAGESGVDGRTLAGCEIPRDAGASLRFEVFF
jgi:hypothetical protein